MIPIIRRDATSSTTTPSRRSFFGRNLSWRDTPKSEVPLSAPKCPLGLTTLYVPDSEVSCDLIFVHGLNGDAQNTWCKNGDPALFWPREWLPKDHGFRDARIHTFGYSSAIFATGGILNIPDFARSLLAAVQDAPSMPPKEARPIILVGHSMGGLVIKNAYILGRQIPEFQPLVERIKAIVFLATPHQGADIAVTLSRILSVVVGKSPPSFVNDLFPQSPIVQSINSEFPRLCDSAESLQLFSFFETRPMNYGIGKGLIVEKHCAVMNYPRERRTYLDADHRDVARYSSTDDPSYVTVRNALAALVDAQRETKSKPDPDPETRDAIYRFLGSPEVSEDDIAMQDLKRLPSSGQWLLQKDSFKDWRDSRSSKMLWIHGRPGAGKSFLAGNVVSHLLEQGYDCCSFFFTSGNSSKGTINAFLRSILCQMAMIHPEIRSKILNLSRKSNEVVDNEDHNSVWRQLYLSGGVSKVKVERQQYWVIDALDECKDSPDILSFLAKAQESWPLCIMVTSREPFRPSVFHRSEVLTDAMPSGSEHKDIALYLRTNIDCLPAPTATSRNHMAEQILERSKGSFLWVDLVLKELRQVYTLLEAKHVLAIYPPDMDGLYLKIVNNMSRLMFGKSVAKAILVWTACSIRPLFGDELIAAIQFDIGEVVDDIQKTIMFSCRDLVLIDHRCRILFTHATARDFLLKRDRESAFAVVETEGHTRLALACMRCLLANTNVRPTNANVHQASHLVSYASEYLFDHLANTESLNDDVVRLLGKFFASRSVLSWIEHISAKSDLRKVHRAGRTITHLLIKRSHMEPGAVTLRREISKLEAWASDLIHVVSKFSHRLRQAPAAIHELIPPFCPAESVIRKQFCKPHRGLSVHGTSGRTWDECLTTITFDKELRPFSTAAGPGFFAIGMPSGKVLVYEDKVFQELQVLDHGGAVWRLKFGEMGKYLASSSARSVRIWDMESWTETYNFPLAATPMVLSFVENDTMLIVATKRNEVMHFDLVNGELRENPMNWTTGFEESGEGPDLHRRAPMKADFSPHQHLLAIVYRGEDILLWDTEQDCIHDFYKKDTGARSNRSDNIADGSTTVTSLTFCTALDSYLLATTYDDGTLVVFNTWTGLVQRKVVHKHFHALTSSPDGHLLAATFNNNILLFDFGTLRCLYRLSLANYPPRLLCFTADSEHIIDIRSSHCRIWKPTPLLRQATDSEPHSVDVKAIVTSDEQLDSSTDESPQITSLCCVNPQGPGSSVVFAGKADGTVHVYDISGEPSGKQLFVQNPLMAITQLHFDNPSGLLSCEDGSNAFSCRKLSRSQHSQWIVGETMLKIRRGLDVLPVTQIIGSGRHSSLLVSSEVDHDTLWPLGGRNGMPHLAQIDSYIGRRWMSHPTNHDCLLRSTDSDVELRSWTDLACISTFSFQCHDMDRTFVSIDRIVPLNDTRYFVTVDTDSSRVKSQSRFHVWDFKDIRIAQNSISPKRSLVSLPEGVRDIVGVYGERLVYLDFDYWICSIDISESTDLPVRHFFIPNDWVSSARVMMLAVTKAGEILFVKQSDLAVIKRGLVTDSGTIFNNLPQRSLPATGS